VCSQAERGRSQSADATKAGQGESNDEGGNGVTAWSKHGNGSTKRRLRGRRRNTSSKEKGTTRGSAWTCGGELSSCTCWLSGSRDAARQDKDQAGSTGLVLGQAPARVRERNAGVPGPWRRDGSEVAQGQNRTRETRRRWNATVAQQASVKRDQRRTVWGTRVRVLCSAKGRMDMGVTRTRHHVRVGR